MLDLSLSLLPVGLHQLVEAGDRLSITHVWGWSRLWCHYSNDFEMACNEPHTWGCKRSPLNPRTSLFLWFCLLRLCLLGLTHFFWSPSADSSKDLANELVHYAFINEVGHFQNKHCNLLWCILDGYWLITTKNINIALDELVYKINDKLIVRNHSHFLYVK